MYVQIPIKICWIRGWTICGTSLQLISSHFCLSKFQYLICIGLALEAHGFWMPTSDYRTIVEAPTNSRGKKGKQFIIPKSIYDGPQNHGIVTIQMAFICPDFTFVFADHNVMVTFHIMCLTLFCVQSDLTPSLMVSFPCSYLQIS